MLPRQLLVHDANSDALERRVAAVQSLAPSVDVQAVPNRAAVLLLAEAVPANTPVLIDLFSTDGVALDRPGERLIRRLVRHPATAHVRPIAWSAQRSPDVIRGVVAAGALGFVAATLDREAERSALSRILAGEVVWPDAVPAADGPAASARWFQRQYGIPWEPWIEPTLVRLASSRERSAVLEELVEQGAAKSTGQAATRLRLIARAVAGEHRTSPTAVAAAASIALSQIAAHRNLEERPPVAVSLEHGARAIRSAPSLVRAAGLTDEEIDEILAVEALIRQERLANPASPGAPAADEARNERHWAAGRRARERGVGVDDVDDVIAGILVQLDEALGALDDARQEELYFPEGRAGAALSLVGPAQVAQLDEVDLQDGVVTWRGMTPTQLAVAHDIDMAELVALVERIDAWFVAAQA